MPVPFEYLVTSVDFFRQSSLRDFCRPCPEAHAGAFCAHTALFFKQGADRLRRVLVELRAIRVFNSANVAGEFDGGDLHSEAEAEKRDLVLAGKARRFN